jgi:hypothetical protein
MAPQSADEAIEVFDLAVGDLLRTSALKASKERMRTLKDLDTAAIVPREVWLKIRSVAEVPDGDIRAALDEMDLAAIHAAADVIGDIAREPDEDFQEELLDRYATVRRFLPKLLKHLDFDAGAAIAAGQVSGQGVRRGHEVLAALDFLKRSSAAASTSTPARFPQAC